MAHYPADTFQEATEIAIEASNQLHGVINGDANAEVTVEDGSKIPSVRKAMVDGLYFKPPIAWAQGEYEDTYNQLREFVDGDVRTWWFAKGATVSTPVLMTTNPATDVNWTLWSAVTLNAATYETQKRLAAEAGLDMVGSFLLGATVTTTDDVVFYETDGKYYGWGGTLPKIISAGSTPATPGGIGAGAWVDRTQETLRSELAGLAGTDLIGFSHDILYSPLTVGFRLKNTVYATDTPFNAPTDGSDAASSINSALEFCAANNKNLILDRFFNVGSTINIPSNVEVICLTRLCGINSTAVGENQAVYMSGVNSKFIGGTVKGINNPASTTIRQDGIYMASTSAFCEVVDVDVYGFFAKNFTGQGFGAGISDHGVSNKIKNCRVTDSKFCIDLRGRKGEVVSNYISNHFLTQTAESKPWTFASNYWDGIVSEGIEDYLIAFNTVTECGQSGIYTGGNGGLSKSNRIIGNLVEKCWNRGIDQGLSIAKSASNDVISQIIVGNICRNNRENNIWLAGTTRCNVSANTSIYDSEYAALFTGYYGGHTGIALGDGAEGAVPNGNSITANNCYDSERYANIVISCSVTATSNTVNGNDTPQGVYLSSNELYSTNHFDFLNDLDFTPVLIGGSGVINLSSAIGSVVISGRRASFNIQIYVDSTDSPSGHLQLGYVPILSGKNVRFDDVSVRQYNGLDATINSGTLVAYLTPGAPDQVNIARLYNGSLYFDVRGFMKAGSTITISGDVEFYS